MSLVKSAVGEDVRDANGGRGPKRLQRTIRRETFMRDRQAERFGPRGT
jgi:hypothetical protein